MTSVVADVQKVLLKDPEFGGKLKLTRTENGKPEP